MTKTGKARVSLRLRTTGNAGGEALAVETLLDALHKWIFGRVPIRVGIDGFCLFEPIDLRRFLRLFLRAFEPGPATGERLVVTLKPLGWRGLDGQRRRAHRRQNSNAEHD